MSQLNWLWSPRIQLSRKMNEEQSEKYGIEMNAD